MPVGYVAILQNCGGTGRAHSSQFRMGSHVVLDRGMRALVGGFQGGGGIIGTAVQEDIADGFHGEHTGDLSSLLTAHAVCDHNEPTAFLHLLVVFRFRVTVIVFVPTALISNVG